MKPSFALDQHRAAIRQIVLEHRACNPRVFGSVLRGKDGENSDLDLLIEPTAETSLMDVAKIQVSLERLLGVPVDVLTPAALPDQFRKTVLEEAVPV
ncbi:nucleotidyltransferase family protein [Amphibiibacter pelophylacis]|uniref:Nucleotidyltransferase family protein n=1 Tax=Amphibiibacter pelophylacis TaxID=1799477 RepID=A0ACC6P0Z9_9BURK